jgi:Velvet factor
MFILNVDLWAEDGTREVNLVRHSQTSPSISSTAAASFSDVTQAAAAYTNNPDPMRNEPPAPQFHFDAGPNQGHQFPVQSSYTSYPGPPPVNSYPQSPGPPPYGEVQYQQGFQTMNGAGYPQNGYPSGVPIYYGAGIHAQAQGGPQQGMDYGMVPQPLLGPPTMSPYDTAPFQPSEQGLQRNTSSQAPPSGMFTRNLIGSLAASAFRLTDPDDRIGIWFVLQDLSVRTEGHFRYALLTISNSNF